MKITNVAGLMSLVLLSVCCDTPGAVVRFFDTADFALETRAKEIAAVIGDFHAT